MRRRLRYILAVALLGLPVAALAASAGKVYTASGVTTYTRITGWAVYETGGSTAAYMLQDGFLSAPTAPTGALAGTGAGNVDNGDHLYKVTYVTAEGETTAGTASGTVSVADKTLDGKVSLTSIPVSSSSRVTARKVYRTEAGGATYKLLTTISDNTTTTYTDNTADSGLGATAPTYNTSGGIVGFGTLAANGAATVTLSEPISCRHGALYLVLLSGALMFAPHGG